VALRVRRRGAVEGTSRRGWLITALAAAAVSVLLPLATFLVSAWLLGWQLQTVLSGSMSPTYPVGALLVVGQIDASDVRPGMAIVFEDPAHPGRVVTHRVVERVSADTIQFRTQGDANAAPDPAPVPARFVRGRVLWQVNHLGSLMELLQWPRSFVLLVALPGLLFMALEWNARRARHGSIGSPDIVGGTPTT
jgi:signal peptidase